MGVDTMGGSAHEGNVISVTLQGLGSFPCLPPPLPPHPNSVQWNPFLATSILNSQFVWVQE